MAGRQMRRLGQLIRQAEHSGPGAVDIGHTIADPSGGWVDVDIAGAIVPCRVPGSFRTTVRVDQDVRVSRSGGVRTVTEIITALPAAPVNAAVNEPDGEAAWYSSTLAGQPDFLDAGFSNAGFTDQDWEIALYAEEIAWITRDWAPRLNSLMDAQNATADGFAADHDTLTWVVQMVNQMRAALIDAGLMEGL